MPTFLPLLLLLAACETADNTTEYAWQVKEFGSDDCADGELYADLGATGIKAVTMMECSTTGNHAGECTPSTDWVLEDGAVTAICREMWIISYLAPNDG